MIKTGYASDFNKKHERPPNSGTVILITRGMPFSWLDYDEWIQDLGPTRKTWRKWWSGQKTEEDWKIYKGDYYPEMEETKPLNKMEELRQRSKNGETITLLCYCPPGVHCHRYIVKSLIEGSSTVIESD